MAYIFPKDEDIDDLPYSEKMVYDFLSKLNESFYVFHSVQWVKKSNKWKSTWKENDFLILNRNLGMLVLEVKGGEIHFKDGVFHQINLLTKEDKILDEKKKNDPLSQAVDGAYHYRKLLDKIEYDFCNRFPVEICVWFSGSKIDKDINYFPLSYREVKNAILDYSTFEYGTKKIYEVFDYYNASEKVNITDDEFKNVLDLLAQDFDLIVAPGMRKGVLDNTFLKLTNEQVGLLDYISEQKAATIQGVAGTGKTLIAKEAAKRFANEGKKVLFICFNALLFQDLKKRYPYDGVTYFNIHTFINQFSKLDLSSDKTRVSELEKIDWDILDYDDVIVDEAQDFDNKEIIYFKNLAEIKNGRFLVFYDKNQLIQKREIPEWITNAECKLLLTKNCRNTYEVAITSYNIIDIELNQKVKMVRGDDTTISFVQGESLVHLRNLINHFTADLGYEHGDICILTLKTEDESLLSNINKIGGINISRTRNNSTVFFTTAKKFKGLESRVVIIIDIDEKDFSDDESKRIFYVACSRATQQLSLFLNGNDAKINTIANAINWSTPVPSKGKIILKTKTKILNI